MQNCLITFLSQTQAGRFRSMAKREGFRVSVVQTPKALSFGGCSFAARFARSSLEAILSFCKKYGISYSRIFYEFTDERGRTYYEEFK